MYDVPQIGCKMFLRDELDLFGFMQNAVYEPEETEIVKKYVKPGTCCLDIGANIGYYSVLMAELGAWVSAFEPNPENFRILEQNTLQYDKVNVLPCAVSDKNGTVDMFMARVGQDNINHGMHRMYKSKWCFDEPIRVITLSIDSLNKEYVDFVKIDVEGWEFQVLQGMEKTIQRLMPTMMIEFHPPALKEAGTDPEALYHFLKAMGYDIYLIPDMKKISYADLVKRTVEPSGQNILCSASK